jgi:hypothetical protein
MQNTISMETKTVETGKNGKETKHNNTTRPGYTGGKQLGTPIVLTPNIVGRHNDMLTTSSSKF